MLIYLAINQSAFVSIEITEEEFNHLYREFLRLMEKYDVTQAARRLERPVWYIATPPHSRRLPVVVREGQDINMLHCCLRYRERPAECGFGSTPYMLFHVSGDGYVGFRIIFRSGDGYGRVSTSSCDVNAEDLVERMLQPPQPVPPVTWLNHRTNRAMRREAREAPMQVLRF
jgi:hypothetical protein